MEHGSVLAGRYEVGGLLGHGGMAEVYRARDLRLDREVAVKVLRASGAADPAFRARFRREALAAASLNHPLVVAVFDAGGGTGDSEPAFLVMERVAGRTLAEVVRDGGPLEPERAVPAAADVLEALGHAHEHGIVHRDVKPANVMVADGGGIKVMDFGIARPMGTAGATVTGTAMVVGTAEYLSPEQARGLPLDERCDLYSAGCLVYELLTGRPPFTGPTPLAVAWQQMEDEPLPPSALRPGIPAALDAVVLRALAKDREDRWPDAASMRAALLAALRAPAPAPVPAAAFAAAPTATAPATAPATATATAVAPAAPDRAAARAGRRRPGRGRRTAVVVAAAVALVAVVAAGGYALSGGHHASPRAAADGGTGAGSGTDAAGSGARHGSGAGGGSGAGRSGTGSSGTAVSGTGGQQDVRAPDLRGRTLAEARVAVLAHHLRLAAVRAGGCPAPATGRQVCGQDPAPGSAVAPGSGISLQVSAKRH